MNKSDTTEVKTVRRTVQPSTTLNRKYVARPSVSNVAPDKLVAARRGYVDSIRKATPTQPSMVKKSEPAISPATKHPLQAAAIAKMNTTPTTPNHPTARELKEQAIRKALKAANANAPEEKTLKPKNHISLMRIFLALTCATVSVLAIAYLVKINMPDVTLKVAAIQTGIEASYPNYIPHDFKLDDIASEQGKITLKFTNETDGTNFVLTEEVSSWDSTALLNNFVKDNFTDNFSTIKEQGLTIFMDDRNAAWVNQGIIYKLTFNPGVLIKTQIKSIATSL